MADFTQLELQILDKKIHDRSGFDCGVEHLNKWFSTTASAAAVRNLSRTKVLVSPASPATVLGYYAISNCTVRSIPKYPRQGAPALLLARMAVDRAHQGKRIGEQLLLAAIKDIVHISLDPRFPPVIGLVVDPKNGATDFYLGYGFTEIEMDDGSVRLFMSVSECMQVVEVIGLP